MNATEMTLDQRRASAGKLGIAVTKKYGLSTPQIGQNTCTTMRRGRSGHRRRIPFCMGFLKWPAKHGPYDPVLVAPGETDETTDAWKLMAVNLEMASTLLKDNDIKVLRITDAGRAVAAEFKFAIGAEEE